MLLLPVQDRGCEVKEAAASLQTPPWKWLIALLWCSLPGVQLWFSLLMEMG